MIERSEKRRRRSLPRSGPGIAAAVLGTLAVLGAIGMLVVVLVVPSAPKASVPAGAQDAIDAARQTAVNLTTYNRATFDADWQRALNSMTGTLKTQQTSLKAQTEKALVTGQYDLKGAVDSVALVSYADATAVVLVRSDGYRVVSGKSTQVAANRLQLTMVDTNGVWLASDLQSIGLV